LDFEEAELEGDAAPVSRTHAPSSTSSVSAMPPSRSPSTPTRTPPGAAGGGRADRGTGVHGVVDEDV